MTPAECETAPPAPAAVLRGELGPRTLLALIVGVMALAAVLLVVSIDRIQTTLLERDAIAKGLHWTNGLRGALESVDAVFAGAALSDRDRETIALAFRLADLRAFLIFDRNGRVIAASDPAQLGQVNTSSYWASEVLRGSPHVATEEVPASDGAAAGVVAETYLPVFAPGGGAQDVVGAFEAYLDVSDSARSYGRIGLYASAVGVALIAAAGLVAVAFVRRTMTFRIERERMLAAARRSAEASSAAKSRFLATVSHEIRTPMNGVLATAELLETTALDPEQRDMVAVVRRSGAALLELLNQVLDQSKIEAGKIDIVAAPFVLRDLLDQTADVIRPAALAKGLALTVDAAPDLPAVVTGDAARLRQILLNLLGNAVKFTAQGGVDLSVGHATGDAGAGGSTAIRVRDTGIGIGAEALERLFMPFEQADASTTREYGGTGLGLAIARELAELMGGSLTVSSTPGAGSEFVLTLPLPASSGAPAAPAVARPVGALGLSVLVADDDPTNRWVIARQLDRLDCRATIVEDGGAALDAWRAAPGAWQAIVTDWHMPVLDGFGLLSALRDDPAFRRAPPLVVMLTASGLPEEVERARTAGADIVLVKPVPLERLAAALAKAGDAAAGGVAEAPVQTGAAAVVLDTTELEALCGGDSAMLAGVLGQFEVRLAEGRDAIVTAASPAARRAAAHALRGAAAAVGAFALSAACAGLEEAGDDGASAQAAVEHEAARLAAELRVRVAPEGAER